MRVSRATDTGLASSKLTPSTFTDNGANRSFAAGEVPRSSAEISASRSVNSRKSNFHGGAAEGGCAAAAVDGGAAAAVDGCAAVDVGGGAAPAVDGCAAAAVDARAGGDCASLSRLSDPSGSSHVTSFTPVSDSESV